LVTAVAAVFQQVHSSSFTEREIQIVLLTDAVGNSCVYAVAFPHRSRSQEGVSSEETDSIRARLVPRDRRSVALSTLARNLIEKRGHLSEQELDGFIAAGFTKGTDIGSHRRSRSLNNHQLCWDHGQSGTWKISSSNMPGDSNNGGPKSR
jgi:hypothetical protein